jgi:hypothetical protein
MTLKNVSDYDEFENTTTNASELADETGNALQQFKNVYVAVRFGRQYSGLKSSEIELQYYRPPATLYDPADTTSASPIYSITGPLNPSFGYRIGATDNRAIGKYGQNAIIGPIQVNFNNVVGISGSEIYKIVDNYNIKILWQQ